MVGENISLNFNLETIYDNASFNINDKDKVGIVGVNGAGKTTLFKVLLKEVILDSGVIRIKSDKKIGYLPQEIKIDSDITVLEYLLSARPIKELEKELNSLYIKIAENTEKESQLLKRISKIQDLLDYYDVYKYETILLEMIDNMNIDLSLLDMKLNNLSGGQKSKIAFLHLLFSKSDLLLLDEPTNHLDKDTKDFVIKYLKNYKGMVLIISHDINFLNSVVNKIMHIDKTNHTITMYKGNYNDFKKTLAINEEIKEKLIEKQDKEIGKLKDFVLQYSNSSGKRKRIAQSREKLLQKKLDTKIESSHVYKKVKLNIKPDQEGSKIPIKVNNISFNYEKKDKLYNNLSFNINNKERFLIIGLNGVGKSTLLKLIVGLLTPTDGNIWYGAKTNIAYYAQELELLDESKTIIENIDSNEYSINQLRTILGSFLFSGDDVFKKVGILSPGEKARVSLCKVVLKKANLLILDEPTNHLDPITQEIIGENFKNYDGTIILVSHNPHFAETIGIDRMLILPSGKITNYSKEKLEYYHEQNQK